MGMGRGEWRDDGASGAGWGTRRGQKGTSPGWGWGQGAHRVLPGSSHVENMRGTWGAGQAGL